LRYIKIKQRYQHVNKATSDR